MEIIDLQNKTKQEIINILDNAFSIKERKSFLLGYSDIYRDNKRIFRLNGKKVGMKML